MSADLIRFRKSAEEAARLVAASFKQKADRAWRDHIEAEAKNFEA